MKRLGRLIEKVVVVVVPINSPAGVAIEGILDTDKDYQFVTGVDVQIGQPGSVQNAYQYLDFGLRDAQKEILGDSHMNHWISGVQVEPDNRFRRTRIKSDGRKVYARVIPPSIMTAAMTVQFIFRFEDTNEVVGDTQM